MRTINGDFWQEGFNPKAIAGADSRAPAIEWTWVRHVLADSTPAAQARYYSDMLSRQRLLPAGFIEPCLPTKASSPPSGGLWIHEIKHDGFRIIARKDGPRVRLYSRPGNDLSDRFPQMLDKRTLPSLLLRELPKPTTSMCGSERKHPAIKGNS